jgi:DNA-binding beta-propeller fold protein YncE
VVVPSPAGKGSFALAWGSLGSGAGQFDAPNAIATDALGNVYVSDYNNSRIQKFSPRGKHLADLPLAELAVEGIAVSPRGRLFVTDNRRPGVVELSSSGQVLNSWGAGGTGPGQFKYPNGLALDRRANIYVADSQNNRVQKLSPNGQSLWSESQMAAEGLRYPVGVATGRQGNVYVTDQGNGRVVKLSGDGKVLLSWTLPSGGNGQSSTVGAIALNAIGNVFVADPTLARIYEFSARGRQLAVWGTKGRNFGQLTGPVGLAIGRQGGIYVIDEKLNRVTKFAPIR